MIPLLRFLNGRSSSNIKGDLLFRQGRVALGIPGGYLELEFTWLLRGSGKLTQGFVQTQPFGAEMWIKRSKLKEGEL